MYFREGNEPEETTQITYRELLVQVCRCSNVLQKQGEYRGYKKGTGGSCLAISEDLGEVDKEWKECGNRGTEKVSCGGGAVAE